MFIYFDRNGVLQEVINDKSARLGDLNANEIYVYVDEVELDDIWLTLKRPDGTLSVEKSFIANKVVRELPYDPKRDMKFFKDYKEYEFYKFTITDEITIAGVYQATIRMTYEDTLSALGVLVFKAETGVIKSDQNITQAQYDYLIWYVGSWQGQIGDLEDAMGIAEADILGLQNRMNVAEQDINKIEDGTTVVHKALKDDLGNTIKSTYANKLDLVYSSSNNRIAITLKSYDGNTIDADLIDLPKATTTADGLLAKEDKVKINNIATDIASMGATKQSLSEKNQINGYAGLDGNAKIPSVLLPDSVLGQLEYKGTFTPTAYPLSPEKGWFYISIGNGTISGVGYQVGDWAVYNGSTWDKIDNTDAVMSVNGKLGVVVLNGTDIQVGNGDTWTIEQRIVNIYAEIEQRITDLLGLANLQDTAIEWTSGVYDLSYNGSVVSTFPATLVSDYNWVFVRVLVGTHAEYTMFKPSVSTSGVGLILPLQQKDVYASVKRVNGNYEFALYKKNDNTLSTTTATMKAWGVKLDGINATEVDYDNSTSGLVADKVQGAIDEVVVELNTLDTKIDSEVATLENNNKKQDIRINEIEELARKSASGETSDNVLGADIIPLNKNTANAPMSVEVDGGVLEAPNLVVNGDLTLDSNSDGIPDGFAYTTATNISLTNGIAKFTPTATASSRLDYGSRIVLPTGTAIYTFVKLKTTDTLVRFVAENSSISQGIIIADGQMNFNSFVGTMNNSNGLYLRVWSLKTSDWTPIEVDYIGAFNVSTMKLKGVKSDNGTLFSAMTNADIKTQLDLWVSKGILLNDNLLSVNMNKRVRSVSSDTLTTSDLYLQANTKGYSLPNGVKDTIEYRNGKYYFVKRVDDTDLNNLVELSPYVETEIEAWGNLQGYESGVVYVDDIKIDASIYNSGITTTSEIKTLDEIVKIINGVETQIDTSLAVIAVDKLSFTHPDLVDGDYVWFAYEEDGNYYKATTDITYYIDKLVRTSPDGSVWKLDWSVSNAGVITWTPTKI